MPAYFAEAYNVEPITGHITTIHKAIIMITIMAAVKVFTATVGYYERAAPPSRV